MPSNTKVKPTYSHGGANAPNWAAVSGTVQGGGRPIDVGGTDPDPFVWPVMMIFCAGGTATVKIEANGGDLDSTGNPPSGEWVDISGGGYSMTAGTSVAKNIPPTVPFIRTNITAISGATVTSYIPLVYYPGGRVASAQYPSIKSFYQS